MPDQTAQNRPQLKLDKALASRLSAAVITTFTQFFSLTPAVGAFTVLPGLTCPGDLSGMIALVPSKSPQIGSLFVCFPLGTLLPLMEQVYQTQCTELNELVQGGAAELTNVIFGMVKKDLNERDGFGLRLSLPEVLLAEKVANAHDKHGETLSVPFQVPQGEFWVLVSRTIQSEEI